MTTESSYPYKSYSLTLVYSGFLAAAILWFVMFSPITAHWVNFWLMMSISAGVLTLSSLVIRRSEFPALFATGKNDILLGLGSAFLLYAVFYVGNILAHTLFPFAGAQVGGVYATRSQADTRLIGLLLLLWIGPAEEVFWRGFAQEQLMQRYGRWQGFIVTTVVYTVVHLPSMNFMLIVAALFAGIFWGLMYMRYGRLAPCIISHAVWDCLIFAVIPISPAA